MTKDQATWLHDFILETRQRLDAMEAEITKLKKRRKPPAPTGYAPDELASAREVLNKVNEHAGSSLRFETSPGNHTAHVKWIIQRLRKGATVHQMRLVAWHVCHDFTGDDGVGRKYCRPETLYGGKFDGYLDDAALAYAEAERCTADEARSGERVRGVAPVGELVAKLEVAK